MSDDYNDDYEDDEQEACPYVMRSLPRLPEDQVDFLCRLAKQNDPDCPHEAWMISLNNHNDYYIPNKDYSNKFCRICKKEFHFDDEKKYWEFVMEHAKLHLVGFFN